MAKSHLEEAMDFQLRVAKVRPWEREHRFHATRRWRFDFAWPELKLALEIHGGGGRGRHGTAAGLRGDAEKMSHAVLAGWRVLVATDAQVRNGSALAWVEEAIRGTPMAPAAPALASEVAEWADLPP